MKITVGINRINLSIALIFMCFGFSFNAIAQNKSLDAKALSALVADLKEVVSTNVTDEKKSASIIKKWDARKDLAGKSKDEVVDLLYEDVKSIIKNPGTQYQIYSIFSMYRQIPDEAFSKKPSTTDPVANSKPEIVKKLAQLTFGQHPYVGIEEENAKLPGTQDVKTAEAEALRIRIEIFDEALKANRNLNTQQKAFVRANYAHLNRIVTKLIDDTIKQNFPTEQCIFEGLEKSYSAKFNLKELNELLTYFNSESGQCVLKYVRQTSMEELIIGNGGKLNYTLQEKNEYESFAATALGQKFLPAYLEETIIYEESKENAVRKNDPNADGFAILETANLNNLFERFVKENY